MAKPKPSAKSTSRIVGRVFDRTTTPVFLVTTDSVIGYANQACADWVGVDLDDLISLRCQYTSRATGSPLEIKAQGLCPPPESLVATPGSLESQLPKFHVWTTDEQQRQVWRSATGQPFFNAEQDHLGVLVICSAINLTEPPPSDAVSASSNPTQAHAALAQIRTQIDRAHSLDSLVGTSPLANRLRRQVQTAVDCQADLLIIGPHGSGREHLARTIHAARNTTHSHDLLPVHCSIVDQPLIQQNIKEIVNSRRRSQLTTEVEQDWLLLIDVDQLGESAQLELLGFFQLPNFPLRTIATSTKSLVELAGQGDYSIELAYHLSAMLIELAPLSQRSCDIPFLAQAILESENMGGDRQFSDFTKPAMQQLIEFAWPDNLDQLKRTIQMAIRDSSPPQITEHDLPAEFHAALQAQRIGSVVETEIQLDQYLGRIEKELIERALSQAKGNKTKAAKLLGISRPKLLRRLQFFHLDETDTDAMADDQPLDSSAFEELK